MFKILKILMWKTQCYTLTSLASFEELTYSSVQSAYDWMVHTNATGENQVVQSWFGIFWSIHK